MLVSVIKIPAYVIALEPEKELYDKVNSIKLKARNLSGNQLYIDDPPHLTICLGIFKDYKIWRNGFSDLIEKIKVKNGSIECYIDNWDIFSGDIITKKETLICKIKEPYQNELRILQAKISEFMLRFKDNQTLKRYENIENFDNIQKSNIEKYGFPFIGEIWIPHIGIASFDKDIFKEVYSKLKSSCPKGLYKFSFVNVYELDQATEQLTIVQKFRI